MHRKIDNAGCRGTRSRTMAVKKIKSKNIKKLKNKETTKTQEAMSIYIVNYKRRVYTHT